MVCWTRQIARKVPSFAGKAAFWENLLASFAQTLAALASRPLRHPWATCAFRQGDGLVRNVIESATDQALVIVIAESSAPLVLAAPHEGLRRWSQSSSSRFGLLWRQCPILSPSRLLGFLCSRAIHPDSVVCS